MNRHIKRAAQLVLPTRAFATIQSIRSRNYQQQLHKEWGVCQATSEMIEEYGLTVLHGPFRGMRYPHQSLAQRDGIPILFGTYELELHPFIEAVAKRQYDCIIDVGSAEGYYAVGLALRMQTPVTAFDCEPRERHYLRQMAKLNGVSDLVQTKPWCNEARLSRLVTGLRTLVICDCEGYEVDLFTGRSVAALKHSDLIIELHDNFPGTSVRSEILERFRGSHQSKVVTFDQQNPTPQVPNQWQKYARERRSDGQQWVYLTASERNSP